MIPAALEHAVQSISKMVPGFLARQSFVPSPTQLCLASCSFIVITQMLCVKLQGIQVFVDDMSGFGGIASSMLPDLKDDIGIETVLMFALRASRDAPAQYVQQVWLALETRWQWLHMHDGAGVCWPI